MKRLISSMLMVALATTMMAVPAKRGVWRNVKLADGTEVRAQLMGDEHAHFWMTEDGRRLIRQGNSMVEAQLQILAKRAMARRPQLKAQRKRVNIGERTSYTGKKRGIVILAQYKDVKFKSANNLAKYKRILNEEGYTTSEGFRGSVADYFKAQSRGLFELDFDVVGPFTMPENRSYYGANDSDDNDQNAEAMVIEACRQADAEVNFKDYDWDGDGWVDQVFVLYAGTGEADSYDEDAIWPHMYELSATNRAFKLDGVTIDTYACSNEVDMSGNIEGIGCFCHEFSHCMGFPDFYDIMYDGNFGMSEFDLMDQGSYNGNAFCPAGYSAHEKIMCGWQEPEELDGSDANIESLAALSEGGKSYIIYNKAHPDEYFMLENRQRKGWDAELPATGLMVTHVDFDKEVWYNNIPNSIMTLKEAQEYGLTCGNTHQRCTIVHADNDDDSKYWNSALGYYTKQTLTNDLFPYGTNDSLSNLSRPAATLFNANTDGTKYLNHGIFDIRQNADGTVSFRYQAVVSPKGGGQTGDYVFYESFDECDGTGGNDGLWSSNIATAAFSPDNEGWVAEKAWGADQCAKFGTSSVAGEAQTPEIMLADDGTLTFMAGAWNAKNDKTELTVTCEGGEVEPSTFTLAKGEWTTFEAKIIKDDTLSSIHLTFTSAGGRFFLDEVKIVKANADGIEFTEHTEKTEHTEGVYDLTGRQMVNGKLPRGLYIKNGKKVMVR
ncbi:MAG: M6 family metalloprotease domain-containing protein [Bacteroidaceae bacterium]|nr:M6 family metalloprotease domain-containing protein [Bacteroidaceae bacterium]